MNFRRLPIALLLTACLYMVSPCFARGPENSYKSTLGHNGDAVLRYLRPTLADSGEPTRLYYQGACEQNPLPAIGDPFIRFGVLFPHVDARMPSSGETGLAAVRDVFQDDKSVGVTQGPSDIIRIRIGRVSETFLQTKISLLRLTRTEQYNPTPAIEAIETADEVRADMRSLRLSPQFVVDEQLLAIPAKGLPHISANMRGVTMDQALDSVAGTFKGIVAYGECTDTNGESTFRIDFIPVASFASAR